MIWFNGNINVMSIVKDISTARYPHCNLATLCLLEVLIKPPTFEKILCMPIIFSFAYVTVASPWIRSLDYIMSSTTFRTWTRKISSLYLLHRIHFPNLHNMPKTKHDGYSMPNIFINSEGIVKLNENTYSMRMVNLAYSARHSKIMEFVPGNDGPACIPAPAPSLIGVLLPRHVSHVKGPKGWDLHFCPHIFKSDNPHLKPFLHSGFQTRIIVLLGNYTCANLQLGNRSLCIL